MEILRLDNVSKTYVMGEVEVRALRGFSLTIESGDYVCVMGPSGCGKSTLLNILGCLDQPSAGHYHLGGQDVSRLPDDDLSLVRSRKIGFIFQSYNLIPHLTVAENIEMPLYYQGVPEKEARDRAVRFAERVGLGERIHHKSFELSGGQQQRVAIARSLATDPIVIFADEATGNLDSKSGEEILNIFQELNEQGKTLVFVTHDEKIANRCKRIVRLRDGFLESDERQRPL